MKKWLARVGVFLGLIIAALIIYVVIDENDYAVITNYVRNEQLATIKADWKGTPVDQKGRFVNHEHPFLPHVTDMLKWVLSGNPQKEEKQNDKDLLQVLDPADFLSSD